MIMLLRKLDPNWIAATASVVGIVVAVLMSLGTLGYHNPIYWMGALITLLFALTLGFALHMGAKKLPISHMVSFIGYPRSGKTTLITSLFAEIFAQRILRGVNIIPRGEETIRRVNEDIARLETGQELGATTDQDIFNYRVEMLTGRTFLSRRYKIEIGDFPGEDSENLSNKDVAWLHETKYFQWALNADVFIFVIDLEYLSDLGSVDAMEYKSTLEKAFRAAWQSSRNITTMGRGDCGTIPS
uniref:50S ribosome-binding GTPase n=1 Tax=Candidatus Kentrum eta TaxID=2126337 RepID=A0A450UAP0_9GAMM|nr:MAG: 50S ribosome-binding GTPase [Candidatus Kentron sp. H]VFJ91091.1 MAG: 50S ribosome-binding GTPase [Candidatus Kentron sp. H]VFJ97400.1 MAG: 50S ribosome-binding GTPase [Candidatus Kentron sp. H]